MNTNHINNKNLKRIAIAAGTTAAALFLSAGLVACGGTDKEAVSVGEATQMVQDALAGIELPAVELPTPVVADATNDVAAPVAAPSTKVSNVTKPSAKKSKKSTSAATGGSVIVSVPEVNEQASAPATTVAPVVTEAPAAQPTDTVAAPADAPAVQQPAAQQPAASGSTSILNFPSTLKTITSIPSLTSTIDTSKLLSSPTTIKKPCLSINC